MDALVRPPSKAGGSASKTVAGLDTLEQIVKISTTARTDWSFATTLLAIAAVLLLLPFSGRAATLATAPMQLAQAAAPEAVPMLLAASKLRIKAGSFFMAEKKPTGTVRCRRYRSWSRPGAGPTP